MKKKLFLGGMLLLFLVLSACNKRTKTGGLTGAEQGEEVYGQKSENTGSSGIPIRIYHSDDRGENLCVSMARTEEITPEILLLNLSYYNMVPDTAFAQSFEQKKQEDGLLLTLDLSEDFEKYLSELDSVEETLVLGSVVNTFLDAYRGSSILITAGGDTLNTGHGIYQEALELYPYQEASYQVVKKKLSKDQIEISYPQITGLSRESIQEKWNEIIEEHAMQAFEEAEQNSLKVGYFVKTMNDQLLSILIEGYYDRQDGDYPVRFQYTYNIDINSGESVRLAYYQDPDELAEALLNGEGYMVDGELGEEFEERLGILYGTSEQLADALRDFDYGENRETPSGFSYQENGQIHLCIRVPHALGDCVDVALDKKAD